MLCKRIIPTLLYRGTTLVKGEGFNSTRSCGNIMQAAKIYASREVDELILLDVGATPEGRSPNYAMIEKICHDNFAPITVGGGVKSVADVQRLLNAGADKVAIGTNYHLIPNCVSRFGSQLIVGVVSDRIKNMAITTSRMLEDVGAGEIMLNWPEYDGTLKGYDLDLIKQVCEAVSVPVIASGGCSGYEDMLKAINAGASAVAAGALFQFTDATPKGAAQYLHEHGIEVRI